MHWSFTLLLGSTVLVTSSYMKPLCQHYAGEGPGICIHSTARAYTNLFVNTTVKYSRYYTVLHSKSRFWVCCTFCSIYRLNLHVQNSKLIFSYVKGGLCISEIMGCNDFWCGLCMHKCMKIADFYVRHSIWRVALSKRKILVTPGNLCSNMWTALCTCWRNMSLLK